MTPQVSVILTTFNGASRGYLSEAIQSVLNQSFEDFELYLIDDGSTDNTKGECKRYLSDPRVYYIYQKNKGLAGARNTGIKASYGEFVCFLDDDDIWKPDKLQKQITFVLDQLNNIDDWGMVYTWVELIDEQGNIISYRGNSNQGWIYKDLLFGNSLDVPSSVLIKREVFNKVGLFDENFEKCEDWDMWLQISKCYQIFPIKEYLVQYREHRNRLSSDSKEMFHYENAVLRKALSTAPQNIDRQKIYASCYVNRSLAHFSLGEYTDFRKMLRRGFRLSPKLVTLEHIFLLIISFWSNNLIELVKRLKREIHKMVISHKARETH